VLFSAIELNFVVVSLPGVAFVLLLVVSSAISVIGSMLRSCWIGHFVARDLWWCRLPGFSGVHRSKPPLRVAIA
jgi:hypothetical protein